MTQTSSEPATVAPDLRSAFEAVRDHGLRLSAARRIVLAALYVADGPLSAEQIAAGVGGRVPSSDVGSVYRNLEMLTRLGIVRHVHLGHSPSLYAISSAGDQEYLTCERCAAFTAVSPDQLDEVREAIRAKFGYVASFSHFPIVGLCATCAQTPNERSRHTHKERSPQTQNERSPHAHNGRPAQTSNGRPAQTSNGRPAQTPNGRSAQAQNGGSRGHRYGTG